VRRGARVQFDGEKRSVVDGPFAETTELVAGYWLWEWQVARRSHRLGSSVVPTRCPARPEIEIRPVVDIADFGEMVSPEARRDLGSAQERGSARLSRLPATM
jgi:hypothetical protein